MRILRQTVLSAALVWSAASVQAQDGQIQCTVTENGAPSRGTAEVRQDGRQVASGSCGRALSVPSGKCSVTDWLDGALDNPAKVVEVDVSPGDLLYGQDEKSTDVYFIVRGQVTLSGTNLEGASYRFRTLGPWTLTGEVGAFLGYHAPYDAAVEKAGLIYRLTAENRQKIEAEDAGLASDLQRLIITMLGSQLMKTTRTIGGTTG